MGIGATFGWILSGLIVWSNRWLEAETRRQVEWLRSYWVPLSPSWFDTPDHSLQPVARSWFWFWFWYWYSFCYWWNDFAPMEFLCPPLDSTHLIILYSLLHSFCFDIGIGFVLVLVEWFCSYWVPLSPSSFDTHDHSLQPVAQLGVWNSWFWYWYWHHWYW